MHNQRYFVACLFISIKNGNIERATALILFIVRDYRGFGSSEKFCERRINSNSAIFLPRIM